MCSDSGQHVSQREHLVIRGWGLSSDENRELSSSAPFVGETGHRSFPDGEGVVITSERACEKLFIVYNLVH